MFPFFDYGNFKKKKKTTMNAKSILKGFLFKKSSDGNLHKFLPRTEAELVTMKNGDNAENRIQNTATPIIKSVRGVEIAVDNVTSRDPLSFTLYGKSVQATTTGAQLLKSPFQSDYDSYEPGYTVTKSNMTVTVLDDMGIRITGRPPSPMKDDIVIASFMYKNNEELLLSENESYLFTESDRGLNDPRKINIKAVLKTSRGNYEHAGQFGGNLILDEDYIINGFDIILTDNILPDGDEYIDTVLYPMIQLSPNFGSIAKPFEPYTGGNRTPIANNPSPIRDIGSSRPIKINVKGKNSQEQLITINPKNGLPGIKVDSNGNYVDKDGQEWICDEIDIIKRKKIRRIGEIIVDGSSIKAEDKNSYDDFCNLPYGSCPNIISDIVESTNFPRNRISGDTVNHTIQIDINEVIAHFSDLNMFNIYCAESFSSGSPVKFRYLIEPIEEDLTQEELENIESIVFSSTTTITNDSDTYMQLDYVIDTQDYIDTKYTDIKNILEKRTNGKVRLYENNEGGNVEITSKSGYKWEMDAFDDNLRLYSNTYDGDKYCSYVFPLFEGTNKLAEYTQNIAKNNIITDVLSVNIKGVFEQSYMFPGVIATENASTLKNSPVKSGAFYAYREVFFIPNQGIVGNTYGKTIVRLTEAYPVAGRIWTTVYNTDFSSWSSWKKQEPISGGGATDIPDGV